ncbi:hypothetical protein B0S90_2807 [Caldicellulosiruptor bescii]|uniref:Lipoprotein n=1 Tax=Caldicellulosiruptor bescii TaxID=31899 RepID=A0ABY1S6F5_CALBS|nr:hypothetical protein B0S87_1684 [Caldicellulosiruptor bescii]PBC91864.1 hypothetical protein B0S89_2309 [Caldicellulosiruptor bescii]PBD02725.1 hypothetical protein B0S85_0265 [Caldicellulosiruptor bescii]PBD07658.1 hypothetical protein B0S90_2807 [Caldicellulosiruptor bescii]PBD10222.1 hypothetical protein B0S84_2723 [Caldicellulosiruptor bescii]
MPRELVFAGVVGIISCILILMLLPLKEQPLYGFLIIVLCIVVAICLDIQSRVFREPLQGNKNRKKESD